MKTSAEQLHHGRLELAPQSGSDERLFIDLDICSTHQCPECTIQCSYYGHNNNNGIHSVAELATYALICRRCEDPHCVKACPVNALEQQKDKGSLLIRHNMLCVSCQSCSHACPYGTIYPEHVPLLVHNCDFCMDRRGDRDVAARSPAQRSMGLLEAEAGGSPRHRLLPAVERRRRLGQGDLRRWPPQV